MKLKRRLIPMVFAGLALPIVIAVPTLTVAMKTLETSNQEQSILAFAKQSTADPAKVVANANQAFTQDEDNFVKLVNAWIVDLKKNLENYDQSKMKSWYTQHIVDAKKID